VQPLRVSAYTLTSCLGHGLEPARAALRAGESGLVPCRFETADLPTFVGEIAGVDDHPVPAELARFDCRNNRAADLGLVQDGFDDAVAAAAQRHGAGRVGVFIATSTAGILQTELA
jgi:3-oxoacyl-[acyl-carrier-protein] synthase-1